VKLRRLRQRRRGRIEIIPMIDVMFFLLATFMLASLSLQSLHSLPVNLPRGQAPPLQAPSPITLTVTRDGGLLLNETGVTLDTLGAVLRSKFGAHAGTTRDSNVVVAVDSAAPSGIVVQAMLKAREAGVERFLFAVAPK
jgi:biopolymer transport protein ExbD